MKTTKDILRPLALAAALLAIALPAARAQDNIIDEVVMVVGDEAILKSEVEEYLLMAQNEGRKFQGDPYCVVIEELAIQKLFLNQAEIDSVIVTDADVIRDVDNQIAYIIEQLESREKMEEYFNKTSTQIREMYIELFKNSETVRQMKSKIVGDIKVTPAQVRRFYDSLPPDSLPYIPVQVEVQIITQEPAIPTEEIERVKADLRDYTDRINSGDTQFSTLALFYSEDKASARQGGELPYYGRIDLDPAFATVAFGLTDPDKVSKIVESEFGYHIIQLIDKRGDRVKVRHILRRPQVPQESIDMAMARLDSIADDIRSEKFTFDEGAMHISYDKETRNNYGNMYNSETRSSKFEMQQLPSEVAKAIENMNVGEISKPFSMVNRKEKLNCAIVKLKSRTKGHRATLKDDYQTIQDLYRERMNEKILTEWIAKKQKTTYVRLKEELKDCEFKYPGWVNP